jgi:hypothetical protein
MADDLNRDAGVGSDPIAAAADDRICPDGRPHASPRARNFVPRLIPNPNKTNPTRHHWAPLKMALQSQI